MHNIRLRPTADTSAFITVPPISTHTLYDDTKQYQDCDHINQNAGFKYKANTATSFTIKHASAHNRHNFCPMKTT